MRATAAKITRIAAEMDGGTEGRAPRDRRRDLCGGFADFCGCRTDGPFPQVGTATRGFLRILRFVRRGSHPKAGGEAQALGSRTLG
ncbi:hypothetical protein GCM10018791_52640 [Streptomyces zaomyceticus]|nr:hypothetical protein GCM10018791_52640 [Streptomyces zaomyceticus]